MLIQNYFPSMQAVRQGLRPRQPNFALFHEKRTDGPGEGSEAGPLSGNSSDMMRQRAPRR
jgi:hypothetical protein